MLENQQPAISAEDYPVSVNDGDSESDSDYQEIEN